MRAEIALLGIAILSFALFGCASVDGKLKESSLPSPASNGGSAITQTKVVAISMNDLGISEEDLSVSELDIDISDDEFITELTI